MISAICCAARIVASAYVRPKLVALKDARPTVSSLHQAVKYYLHVPTPDPLLANGSRNAIDLPFNSSSSQNTCGLAISTISKWLSHASAIESKNALRESMQAMSRAR